MKTVNFYHLTKLPIGKALPKLLEKVVESGKRILLLTENEDRAEEFNSLLWTYTTKVFLPHGSKQDEFPEEQPIYITNTSENPNNSTIIAATGDVDIENKNGFEKYLYMFDGNDDKELNIARKKWKNLKDLGANLTYWRQSKKGTWEQAEV